MNGKIGMFLAIQNVITKMRIIIGAIKGSGGILCRDSQRFSKSTTNPHAAIGKSKTASGLRLRADKKSPCNMQCVARMDPHPGQ